MPSKSSIKSKSSAQSEPAKWTGYQSTVRFSLLTDGTTGRQWVTRLQDGGFRLSDRVKAALQSPHFVPTKGVTVNMGVALGSGGTDENYFVHCGAVRAPWLPYRCSSKMEHACLMREKFTGEDIAKMGFRRITVIHAPVENVWHTPCVLTLGTHDKGRRLCVTPGEKPNWLKTSGFAYAVPANPPLGRHLL